MKGKPIILKNLKPVLIEERLNTLKIIMGLIGITSHIKKGLTKTITQQDRDNS